MKTRFEDFMQEVESPYAIKEFESFGQHFRRVRQAGLRNMVVAQHLKKNLWQIVYSFLGFWTFLTHHSDSRCTRTLYWIWLPWGPFYRKFDLFSWDTSSTESIIVQRLRLEEVAKHEFAFYGIDP